MDRPTASLMRSIALVCFVLFAGCIWQGQVWEPCPEYPSSVLWVDVEGETALRQVKFVSALATSGDVMVQHSCFPARA